MGWDVLETIAPYLGILAVAVAALCGWLRLCGTRGDWRQLARLHRDQAGAVQSLSFVLAIPVFMMIMMFVVQVSQITIGRVAVEYSAFSAARSALVWIPARTQLDGEEENRVSYLVSTGQIVEDGVEYTIYEVEPGSPKYDRVHLAAARACMPISPSRFTVNADDHPAIGALESIERAYELAAPSSRQRHSERLKHKLSYALTATDVKIEIRHKESEPTLRVYEIPPDITEFQPNEAGWQDQIVVTVRHNFALLPGPARLFARRSHEDDRLPDRLRQTDGVYSLPLEATVRLGNEGQKPVLPYVQADPLTTSSTPENEYPEYESPGDLPYDSK